MPHYLEIKERIKASDYVGTDEMGAKVNGKKHWFWTWQNDRWASHFHCVIKDHQICVAHLQRELNYIEQLNQSQWAIQLKEMLWRAMEFKKQINCNNYFSNLTEKKKLEQDLHQLLLQPLPDSDKKAKTLQKKLLKSYSYILAFFNYPKVPPDNDGSERAIRNIKVQQKISGQFKSDKGADGFAVIRSIIHTTLKSGQNVLNALRLIAIEY